MPLSLEEMTAVAIRNQHLILAEELKKGVPLNYQDEFGRNVLEYPDGHIEITQDVIPPLYSESDEAMQPRLICICGPNGAGKSTYTRTIATMENLLVIDPDKLAADGLSPIAAGKAAAKMAYLLPVNLL